MTGLSVYQPLFFRLLSVVCTLVFFSSPVQAQLVETAARVKQSVVAIGTYQPARSPIFRFMGTGFVVGNGTTVVTNAHIVPSVLATERKERLVAVIPGDDQAARARTLTLRTRDPSHDLAVLDMEGNPLPALALASDTLLPEGQEIAFTGFPIGNVLGVLPVTHRGIISAVAPIGLPQANSRDLNPALVRQLSSGPFRIYQLDATAYPGNSGSPLFDPVNGEVVGVINMVFVKASRESAITAPSGISYAIPVARLRTLLSDRP